MKKIETRNVIVTYCDYCGKELPYGYASIQYEDGTLLDFCDQHTTEISQTCFEKRKQEDRDRKYKTSQNN